MVTNIVDPTLFQKTALSPVSRRIESAHETAQQFAATFFTQCVNEMLKNLTPIGGFAEEMYQSFLAEAVGEEIAQSQVGREMTEMISQQITRLQEKRVFDNSAAYQNSENNPSLSLESRKNAGGYHDD